MSEQVKVKNREWCGQAATVVYRPSAARPPLCADGRPHRHQPLYIDTAPSPEGGEG